MKTGIIAMGNSIGYNNIVKAIVYAGETFICFALYTLLFMLARAEGWYPESEATLLQALTIITLCFVICTIWGGVVLHRRKVYAFQIVERVTRNIFNFGILSSVLLYMGGYMNPVSYFYIIFLMVLLLCDCIYRFIIRAMVKSYRSQGNNLNHVVLVGSTINNQELFEELASDPSSGYRVKGYFDDVPNEEFTPSCPYLGTPSDVQSYIDAHPEVHYLFCCLPSSKADTIVPIINYCENHLVHFYSVPNLHNYLHNHVFLQMIGNVPVLTLRQNPLEHAENRFIKRTFDIIFSGLFLCTLFPIITLVVAIITKLTMPGPIFFRQKRNGLNDEVFYCIKFRSMKVNSQADTLQASKNDPRKTRWGDIMRRTNIDELPQFINVLLGDMSVVGPRPHMLKHTEEYSKLINKYMVRHFVKPGVTGWSQVTGFRGETKELKDMEGRIKGDIWYIEHWNFWLDIYIIFKTVATAIAGDKKAY